MNSAPQGAAVFLNGQSVGTTPLSLADQPVGSRAVRVELNGYQAWTLAVRVVANERTLVDASLTRTRTPEEALRP